MTSMKLSDHLHALAAKKRTSALGNIALMGVAMLATHIANDDWFDFPIGALLCALSLARLLMPMPRAKLDEATARRWFMTYAALSMGTGYLWGLLAQAHIVVNGSVHRSAVFMLIINAGIAAAGTTSLTPYRRLASAFAFAVLFPMAVSLAVVSFDHYWPIIALLGIYQVFLVMQIRVNSDVVIKLREREEQYRNLVEASNEGIIIHENGLVLEVNPAFTRMFGYEPEEIYKTSIFAIVHPDDRARTMHDMRTHSEDRRILRAIHRDGTLKQVEIRARTTQYKDSTVRVTCIQDITLQVEAERALRESTEQRQRLAIERENAALDALRVKTEFLTNMSHELRTPLNAIIGLTDLLEETQDADVKARYLRTLKSSGEGLLNLVNDILDFSKLDSGEIEFEFAPVSVAAVVENQCDLLADRALAKNLALSTYVDPNLPISVRADGGRLSQIILNLTANAIKFTETGSVAVRALAVGHEPDGRVRVRFEVRDTGVGVAPELEHKMFHTFSQADSSMSRRFGGTGLGLAICKRLVDGMHGIVSFEPLDGGGTLFWCEIPLAVVDAKTYGASRPTPDLNVTVLTDEFGGVEVIHSYAEAWKIPVRTMTLAERRALPTIENEIVIGAAGVLTPATRATIASAGFVAIDRDVRHRVNAATGRDRLRMLATPVRHSDLFDALAELAAPATAPIPLAPTAAAAQPFAPAHVLVVEDNSTNQMLIMALLQRLGLTAQAVVNGVEAVHATESRDYDLILMDCQMPEMDGFDATRRIRERERTTGRRVPIVALTANVMREDRERCVACGMDGFIPKPVRRDKLISELGRFLKAKGGGDEKVG